MRPACRPGRGRAVECGGASQVSRRQVQVVRASSRGGFASAASRGQRLVSRSEHASAQVAAPMRLWRALRPISKRPRSISIRVSNCVPHTPFRKIPGRGPDLLRRQSRRWPGRAQLALPGARRQRRDARERGARPFEQSASGAAIAVAEATRRWPTSRCKARRRRGPGAACNCRTPNQGAVAAGFQLVAHAGNGRCLAAVVLSSDCDLRGGQISRETQWVT